MSGFDRTGKPNTPIPEKKARPNPDQTSTLLQKEMKSAGYTGNVCDICGSVRMKQTGPCMVCEECGSTTGCS